MAKQLAAFRPLSAASWYGVPWQLQQQPCSLTAAPSLRVFAVCPRLQATFRRQLEELTPKELRDLRKKEAQKEIRKIRKERRLKKRAEELARAPVVRRNVALLRFRRPLTNWNKPWKKKKKSPLGTEVDERKNGTVQRESNPEALPVEADSAVMSLWSEFDAVYKLKMNDFANKTGKFESPHEKIWNEPASRGTEHLGSSGRTLTTSKGQEGHPVGGRKGVGRRGSNVPSKKLVCKMDSRGLFSEPPSSKRGEGAGAEGFNGVEHGYNGTGGTASGRGSRRLNGRADGTENGEEDLAQQLSWSREELPTSWLDPWRGKGNPSMNKADGRQQGGHKDEWRRSIWRGDRIQQAEAERRAIDQSVELVNTIGAVPAKAGSSVEVKYPLKNENGNDKPVTVSNDSVPLQTSPISQRPGLESSGSKVGLEITEFWDRRDMHLDERFDRENLRKKFERSAESKTFIRERADAKKPIKREAAKIVVGRRKGQYVYLSSKDGDAVDTRGLPRTDVDESKQLAWLAKQLDTTGRADGVHFSRLMRSGGLKITDGRAVILVQKLGDVGNWRRAMEVVEWVNSRNHFPPIQSKFVFTTLLAVLQRARRPIESLNVFNVMREHVATYPDMAAYRVIAVTLGQSGCMEELFDLMQSLRQGPDKNTKYLLMLKAGGRLMPDIVVYNALMEVMVDGIWQALNSCVPHTHWRCALWILDQLQKETNLWPNSASYGLAIEVMVKAGKFDLAWRTLAKMELGGFHPNSMTYKVLVEALGQVGEVELATEMVKQMEQRGMVPASGVYFALATALCKSGRWKDALLQVDKVKSLSERPLVETYTGLIKACKEAGLLGDAICVFQHMQEVCAPNMGTYNLIISIYGKSKMYEEAKLLFDRIKTGRISSRKLYGSDPRLTPDVYTYNAMLGCCSLSEKWDDMEVLFRQMLLQGFQLTWGQHSWIVLAASKAGKDDLVASMFNHLVGVNDTISELYLVMIHTCLRGGDVENAFSHLEKMVHQDIRISSRLELQEFQNLALQLCEEDRLKFINTLESLRVTSDFNFKEIGRLSSSRKPAFKPPRDGLNALSSNIHHENEKGMLSRTNAQKDLVSNPCSLRYNSNHKNLLESRSDLNAVLRNRWRTETLRAHNGNEPHEVEQRSSTVSDMPGWELLWNHSGHLQQTARKYIVSKQLT